LPCSSVTLAMHEEPTTTVIQPYLDALPGDTAAEIEDRVVIRGFDVAEPQGVCQHRLGCGILLEAPRRFGLALRRVADRVERRLPPLGEATVTVAPGTRSRAEGDIRSDKTKV